MFSGGVDSVVLAHLLKQANYNFELAHCNFKLRGDEANEDTEFCEAFAKQLNIPIHIIYFDTKQFASENKLSIQMAARQLRYDWLAGLLKMQQCHCVLTAHHANDTLETVLVNLVRGTGIKGLQGVPEKQDNRVRPLLFATKEEIISYADTQKLNYREDSSNQETKYKRNFIRHKIIPELKKLNPTIEQTIYTSTRFFKQSHDIVLAFAYLKFKEICTENNNELYIDIEKLKVEKQKETLLFEWLYSKGFKTQQIEQLCLVLENTGSVGKLFNSATHQLLIDRKNICVQAINQLRIEENYSIKSITDTAHLPIKLTIKEVSVLNTVNEKGIIYIPNNDNTFPLTLRRWKQGDKFKPFGMNGFKKLSDFFKDQKLTRFEKDKVWLLCNNEHIIWIVGYRLDERCRVLKEYKLFLEINTTV